MTPEQKTWVLMTAAQAFNALHIYPTMAACEAALESAYGTSQLARLGNNLFGTKQHLHPVCGTLSLPTKEFLDNEWVECTADWIEYPNVPACFADRMATLMRLRMAYPHYNSALMAATATQYIREVSATWSTDPNRADKVLAIYNAVFPQTNTLQVQQAANGEN